MTVRIEYAIEKGIRASLRTALDVPPATAQDADTRNVPTFGFWLPGDTEKDPRATWPCIIVAVQKFKPEDIQQAGVRAIVGKCAVKILIRVSPTGDLDCRMVNALMDVVAAVCDADAFTIADGVTKNGIILQDGDVTLDQYGKSVSSAMDVYATITG